MPELTNCRQLFEVLIRLACRLFKLDQVGLGIFWDKTNLKAVAQPARNAEWGAQLYYNYTISKGLWVTPNIQLYFDPALNPGAGPAAVFTIRTTAFC
jgi:hypothetical protein